MKRLNILMICSMAAFPMAAAAQTVLLSENFEGYADQAALDAAWTSTEAGYLTLVTEATSGALGSNKYVTVPADHNPPSTGAEPYSIRNLSANHAPTDGDPINLTVYVRAQNYSNTRGAVAVRTNATSANMFQLGTNNGNLANKFAARINGWTGSPGFIYFIGNGPDRTPATWFKLEGSAGATSASFKINDVAMTETGTMTATPVGGMGVVRIGMGSSANQPMQFDSITVTHGIAASVSDWDLY